MIYTIADIPKLLLVGLVGTALAAIVNALFLHLTARYVARVQLPYKPAYLISLVVGLLSFILGISAMILTKALLGETGSQWITHVIINLAVGTMIYGRIIRDDVGKAIGIQKGALTAVTMTILSTAFLLVLKALRT